MLKVGERTWGRYSEKRGGGGEEREKENQEVEEERGFTQGHETPGTRLPVDPVQLSDIS